MQATPAGSSYYSDFMTCPTKHHYAWSESLDLIEDKPALIKGTAIHAAINAWYTTPGNTEERMDSAVDAILKVIDESTLQDKVVLYAQLIEVFSDYVTHWGENENNFTIIRSEIQSEILINDAKFTFRIDQLVQSPSKEYYVLDTKTTSSKSFQQMFDDASSGIQFPGYVYGARRITGMPVSGVIINGIRMLKNENQFDRDTRFITEAQLAEFEALIPFLANQIKDTQS